MLKACPFILYRLFLYQNFRVFIIMEIGSKYRCSATYMAAKLSRKWSFFALNELFDEPICTPLHFIGNLNMAPSKKWICQLILLHYNLPCKSIKKNPDWLKPWMTFFSTKGIWHNNFTVLKSAQRCILTKFCPMTT